MKTFLQNILTKIKGFFTKAEDQTKKITLIAIKLTEGLKAIRDGKVDDVVLAIVKYAIPGSGPLVDSAMAFVDKYLPTTILSLKMVNSIANITDRNEQMKAILALFQFSEDIEKNAAYHDFCAKAIFCLSDGKLTWSECVYLAQSGYEDFKLGLLK
jgi:hypothetical protein